MKKLFTIFLRGEKKEHEFKYCNNLTIVDAADTLADMTAYNPVYVAGTFLSGLEVGEEFATEPAAMAGWSKTPNFVVRRVR